MPLATKTFSDFVNSIIGKFTQELPEVDPTIEASLAKTSVITSAIAGTNLQNGIEDAVDQMFWQTADDDFLEKIGSYDQVEILSAESAIGYCSVGGVLNTLVIAGANLTGSNGLTYSVLQDSTVQEYTGSCALSFTGGIVTVITDAEHTLATGLSVTITNTAQTEYEGTFIITVLDDNTFTYNLTAGSLTTDLGDYTSQYVSLNVQCLTTGQNTNITAGGRLSINVNDIDDAAYVQFNSISGGTDIESIDDYRVRVGESHSTTSGLATINSLVFSAKKIAGNTRVFVARGQEVPSGIVGTAGYIPGLGQTVIYILRDNDISITPTQQILDNTKQQIIDDGNWPTLTTEDNLFLLAPIIKQQNFTFTDLVPNTITMQNAVADRLVDYFRDNADVGNPTYTILIDDIKTFLRTITDSTGARLISVTLNNPTSNIIANSGEIYIRGTISYV